MERHQVIPRANWQESVLDLGFTFHTMNGDPYWDESVCYSFSDKEVTQLEKATAELEEMCLQLVGDLVAQGSYDRLKIPEIAHPLIEASWQNSHRNLYGRFDFSYDGVEGSPPKLLEYNADTPTSLLESSIIQWQWLSDVFPDRDQFNAIHEKIVSAWKAIPLEDPTVYFTCISNQQEDRITIEYLQDTALQAGLKAEFIDIEDIGWNGDSFVDLYDNEIQTLFKLYPWEWLLEDEFAANIIQSSTLFMEPAWKMLLSNKGILALLWEKFPNHPYLLPAYLEENKITGKSVKKPLWSREGENIQILKSQAGGTSLVTTGPYEGDDYVYQAYQALPDFDGNYPVIGSWVIASQPAGIGIREDKHLITGSNARFVPHYIK